MRKSPEEYLAALNFDAIAQDRDHLDAGERAFVEKYLGLDVLAHLPEVNPEPVPLPALLPEPEKKPAPALLDEPKIIVVPDTLPPSPQVEVVVEKAHAQAAAETQAAVEAVAGAPAATAVEAAEKTAVEAAAETVIETAVPVESTADTIVEAPVVTEAKAHTETAATQTSTEREKTRVAQTSVPQKSLAVQLEPMRAALTHEQALKEKWRAAAEIQMVSFLVAGQIFLLPVEGIQEVVRHMELIKVPQAPAFVAGAINLRGRVMPVVRLSALLTNVAPEEYSERNFIIITGTDKLQLGLIIDKVSSMHLVQQNKIIWNPESKLAEAAEFLNAIVDLDDHVCGMVAPEAITRLILPELD